MPDRDDQIHEHVELDLPLLARYAMTVRLVAGALVADRGFSVDAIDDLRLGVNEVVSVLTDVDDGEAERARLLIRFEVSTDGIRVEARRTGVGEPLSDAHVDPLAARILGAVVDEFGVDAGVFRIVKRSG